MPIAVALSEDTSQHVRSALAGVIMGMAEVLGKEKTIDLLVPIFLTLLKDPESEVGCQCFPPSRRQHQLPALLGSLARYWSLGKRESSDWHQAAI